MTRDIVLLGLLFDGPRHGYEMKKLIEEDLSRFVELSSGPIYYALKNLETRGLVTKSTGQFGRRPEKQIYQITEKGRREFHNLLHRNFLTLQRPFHNLDLSLYFLKYLAPSEALKMIRERLGGLRQVRLWAHQLKKSLQQEAKPYYLIAISEHIRLTVETEIDFIKNFAESLRQCGKSGVKKKRGHGTKQSH
jgi:DNA-binding PadR family transcriptional regulator